LSVGHRKDHLHAAPRQDFTLPAMLIAMSTATPDLWLLLGTGLLLLGSALLPRGWRLRRHTPAVRTTR
jgi:hypothetical protein